MDGLEKFSYYVCRVQQNSLFHLLSLCPPVCSTSIELHKLPNELIATVSDIVKKI